MKKYLIFTSLFSNDLKEDYEKLVQMNEELEYPFIILSPISMVYGVDDIHLHLLSVAYNMKPIMDLAEQEGKPIIYLGPAHFSIHFDHVYAIKENVLAMQEKTLKTLVESSSELKKYYDLHEVDEASKSFTSIETAFKFIRSKENV